MQKVGWQKKLLLVILIYCTSFSALFAQEATNSSPFIIPALREWKGGTGYFKWSNNAKLVVDPAFLQLLLPAANLFAEDIQLQLPGKRIKVAAGKPMKGSVFFTIDTTDKNLPAEGYLLTIGDDIRISAKNVSGAIWATRSLLQMLEKDKMLPKGFAKDYPQFSVRGFVLDVGRKFFCLEFLQNYVRFMSYYKMNDFHIHLNDNGFKDFFEGNWDSTYSAFRLENETYPNLTAKDGSYSKKEFIELQLMAKRYGVKIIPEIDVPAHSLAFSKAVPGIGSKQYGLDHLDLDNPLTYTVIDNVFKEYLQGSNPVFTGNEVHIGTDEYSKKEAEKFRAFTNHYIKLVESYGKQVRMWGALTHAQGTTPVKSENVTMNLWYNGYAQPKEMFSLGYKGISTPDGWLYIVPAAGYYYDYLNTKKIYNEWTPNRIGDETFDENYSLIRGGSFAVWNDHVGNGITEKDVHHRVFPAMQVLSQKMWGGAVLPCSDNEFAEKSKLVGEGPGLNMMGRIKSTDSLVLSLNLQKKLKPEKTNFITAIHGAVFNESEKAFELKGSNSYIKTSLPGIGYGYTVSFCIKNFDDNTANAVLFGSKDAVVTLNQQGTGQLGFSREGYHYSFDYKLPAGKWTHIVIRGNNKGTSLYVNGVLVQKLEGAKRKLANGKETAKVQTLFFPLQFIGDSKNAGHVLLSQLKVFNTELNDAAITQLASTDLKQ